MSESYQVIEARIQEAIEEISVQKKPNIAKTARDFSARLNGRVSRSERLPAGRKLDATQEEAICKYIDYLESLGMGPKQDKIREAADTILRLSVSMASTPPPKVGEHWLQRFF
ncbi:hypothetical protein N7513_003715 [Penicillium frequentans]|nr:hypothetical protein N7513_003715 [Penicillium glabrum]